MPDPTREEFLERRRGGIGGSDVAAVLGLSRWKTPFQLWEEKTGRAKKDQETESQHFGTVLEAVVAVEFSRRTGLKVQKRHQMYHHPDHPELLANIDRYIVGGGILECKTSNAFALSDWGPTGSDEVPEYYLTQVQHYMHVTGWHDCHLAVLIGGNTFRHYRIEYNRDLAEFAAARCIEFWRDYVLTNTPPPVTLQDDLSRIFPGHAGEVKAADDATAELIDEYRRVSGEYKQMADLKDELSSRIKLYLGNADTLTDQSGKILLTYKQSKDSTSTITDWEGLARELCPPDVLTEEKIEKHTCTVVRHGIRRMVLKKAS